MVSYVRSSQYIRRIPPQLLLYPNPKDSFNTEAASLLLSDESKYNSRVREHVKKFAILGMLKKEEEETRADAVEDE